MMREILLASDVFVPVNYFSYVYIVIEKCTTLDDF